MIEIRLPWPERVLNPNARKRHWRHKQDAKIRAKAWGRMLSMEAGCGPMPGALLAVRLTFFPPDRHRRDLDNLIASMKHHLDGIFVTLETDDSWIDSLVGVRGEVRKGGEVLVEIEEADDD